MCPTRCWAEPELRAALDRYETELKAAGKARSTVAAHVGGPERFLDWLARADCTETTGGPSATHDQSEVNDMRSSLITWRSAYRPLYHHLAAQTAAILLMSFVEIERVLGRRLPASARDFRRGGRTRKAGPIPTPGRGAWPATAHGTWTSTGRRSSSSAAKALPAFVCFSEGSVSLVPPAVPGRWNLLQRRVNEDT